MDATSDVEETPGPKGLPLIGNYLDIPVAGQEQTAWLKWGQEFDSDIVSLSFLGYTMVVVNSYEAASELFDRRGSNYSGRPHVPLVTELLGQSWLTTFIQYTDPAWKTHRRFFHQTFGTAIVKKFHKQQSRAVAIMLQSILDNPAAYHDSLRQMAASVMVIATYGIQVEPKDDPLIARIDQVVGNLLYALTPGSFYVKDFPFLKYVPAWFPGGGFQRQFAKWRFESDKVVTEPFIKAKDEFAKGIATESFVSVNLGLLDQSTGNREEEEQIVQNAAATMYSAGTDTALSVMTYFVLAMTWNPEVQTKAQAEVDKVLQGRLPTFSDRGSLPIVDAILNEVLRFFTLLPLSFPHATQNDDEYKGFYIPAGSIVMGNAWAILHDPKVYPEPNSFNPERFMKDGKINPEVRDPAQAFGFGRRICPGRFLATEILWLSIASLLSGFNITSPLDANGNPVRPSGAHQLGVAAIPLPFECDIKPRSAKHAANVKENLVNMMMI